MSRVRKWRTPQATIEAVLFTVRERGIAALDERANIARLRTFDDAAFEQLDARIERWIAAGVVKDARHG